MASPGGVAIEHSEVGCVVAEQYPRLDACIRPLAQLGRAQIHFRAFETEPWYAVEMKPAGDCLSAFLPKPLPTTPEIRYFVDAVDKGYSEIEKPDRAPTVAYRMRVVQKEADCDRSRRMAASAVRTARPIVLGVIRDAAGRTLDDATIKLLESKLVLAGFSPQGVVVASTGTAPAPSSAASTASAGAAPGHAAAAGSSHTGLLLGVAGGVAAATAVVVATHSSGSGGSAGASPATLTGHFAGGGTAQAVYEFGAAGSLTVTCSEQLAGDFTQNGGTLNGTLSLTSGSCAPSGTYCNVAGRNLCTGSPVTPSSLPLQNGSVGSTGQVTFSLALPNQSTVAGCSGFLVPFQGTLSGNTLTLGYQFGTSCGGASISESATYTLTRQ